MHIERHHDLTPALLEEIRPLAFPQGGKEGEDHGLGEAKRAQLVPGARDWSGVLAREGDAPVGYAHVRWGSPGGEPRATAEVVIGDGAVDDDRALAGALFDEVRAIVAEAGGGSLYVWAHGVVDEGATLPASAGFGVQRRLAVMGRALRERPETGDLPEDVLLRPYRPGEDDGEVLRVNNSAFADHPEQGNWDAATLDDRRTRPWFDPAGLILAWRGERLLGFHWTKVHGGDPPIGEVYVLAVGPHAQGLGLGRLLLQSGLAHLYDQGCRRAILYVDTANTGAVRLYEAAGFKIDHLEVCYEESVAPAS